MTISSYPQAAENLKLCSDDMSSSAVKAIKIRLHDLPARILPSVTEKTRLAPSGNPHDYCSIARYWWANPESPDGMPWIRKDGKTNPATMEAEASDRHRLDILFNIIEDGIYGWLLFDDQQAGAIAAQAILTWFINPDTLMNPHLNYAQSLPGVRDGRGLGIIDTRAMIDICQIAEVLKQDGFLSDTHYGQLQYWFNQFLDWLLTSPLGKEEAATNNNHGSWYDAQVIHYARFAERRDIVEQLTESVLANRFIKQISDDGSQPHEATRTLSWDYHGLNLHALLRIVEGAELAGIHLLAREESTRLLNAAKFLASYTPDFPGQWPWEQFKPVSETSVPTALAMAAQLWPNIPKLHAAARHWIATLNSWKVARRYPIHLP